MLYRKSYKYHMQNIPEKILNPYIRHLKQQNISSKEIPFCLKWLRYYLDFCYKYSHAASIPNLDKPEFQIANFKMQILIRHLADLISASENNLCNRFLWKNLIFNICNLIFDIHYSFLPSRTPNFLYKKTGIWELRD